MIALLASVPGLKQSGPTAFDALPGFPWVRNILAACDGAQCYAISQDGVRAVNIVEVVYSDFGDSEWYDTVARRIAEFLGWQAIEEHSDRMS